MPYCTRWLTTQETHLTHSVGSHTSRRREARHVGDRVVSLLHRDAVLQSDPRRERRGEGAQLNDDIGVARRVGRHDVELELRKR